MCLWKSQQLVGAPHIWGDICIVCDRKIYIKGWDNIFVSKYETLDKDHTKLKSVHQQKLTEWDDLLAQLWLQAETQWVYV